MKSVRSRGSLPLKRIFLGINHVLGLICRNSSLSKRCKSIAKAFSRLLLLPPPKFNLRHYRESSIEKFFWSNYTINVCKICFLSKKNIQTMSNFSYITSKKKQKKENLFRHSAIKWKKKRKFLSFSCRLIYHQINNPFPIKKIVSNVRRKNWNWNQMNFTTLILKTTN